MRVDLAADADPTGDGVSVHFVVPACAMSSRSAVVAPTPTTFFFLFYYCFILDPWNLTDGSLCVCAFRDRWRNNKKNIQRNHYAPVESFFFLLSYWANGFRISTLLRSIETSNKNRGKWLNWYLNLWGEMAVLSTSSAWTNSKSWIQILVKKELRPSSSGLQSKTSLIRKLDSNSTFSEDWRTKHEKLLHKAHHCWPLHSLRTEISFLSLKKRTADQAFTIKYCQVLIVLLRIWMPVPKVI